MIQDERQPRATNGKRRSAAEELTAQFSKHQDHAKEFGNADRFVSVPRRLTTQPRPLNPWAVLNGPDREDPVVTKSGKRLLEKLFDKPKGTLCSDSSQS